MGGQTRPCSLCLETHVSLRECSVFWSLPIGTRSALVSEEGRCISCLEQGHFRRSCHKKGTCNNEGCRGVHSKLLHFPRIAKYSSSFGRFRGRPYKSRFISHQRVTKPRSETESDWQPLYKTGRQEAAPYQQAQRASSTAYYQDIHFKNEVKGNATTAQNRKVTKLKRKDH